MIRFIAAAPFVIVFSLLHGFYCAAAVSSSEEAAVSPSSFVSLSHACVSAEAPSSAVVSSVIFTLRSVMTRTSCRLSNSAAGIK